MNEGTREAWLRGCLPAAGAGGGACSGGLALHRGQRIDHAPGVLPIALSQLARLGGKPLVGAGLAVARDALLVLGHDQREFLLQRTTVLLHVADQRVLVVVV